MTKKENRPQRPSLRREIEVKERALQFGSRVAINGDTATIICEVVNGSWQSNDLESIQRAFGKYNNYSIRWNNATFTSSSSKDLNNKVATYFVTGIITSR